MEIEERLAAGIKAHQAGDLETALTAYKAVLADNPDHPDGLHFLGLLVFKKDDPDPAIALIEHSLDINPLNAAAYNNLANLHKLLGHQENALVNYIKAVDADPTHEEAWRNLSLLAGDLAESNDVLSVLSAITNRFPDNAVAWCSYGHALRRAGQPEPAAEALETSLRLGIEPPSVAVRCTRFLSMLGRDASAIAHLERLAETYPDDADVKFTLAAARGDQPDSAPEDYIKSHFDNFAETFDEVLQALDYDTPQMIADRVKGLAQAAGGPFPDVVDLGCGSGLCGPLLRAVSGKLSGVDLSPGMLQKAAARDVYDFLIEGELVAFLNADLPTQFDVCVCADTLVYLGELQPFFAGVQKALKPGGVLVASVEALDDTGPDGGPYRLHPAGRYSHAMPYLRQSAEAAGLLFEAEERVVLRKERGTDVMGYVFQVRKPGRAAGR